MEKEIKAKIESVFGGKGRAFNYRPLVVCAIAFAIGICISKAIGTVGSFIGAALFLCLLVFAYVIGFRRIALFLFAMILGTMRFTLLIPQPPPEGESRLYGTIVETPVVSAGRTRMILNDIALDGIEYHGRIQLTVSAEDMPPVKYGDRVLAEADISIPRPAMNDGGMDLNTYYRGQGIIALADTESATVMEGKSDLYGWCLSLRTALMKQIEELYPKHYGIVAGLLLGEKNGIPGEDMQAFRVTGAAHLLAVSGLHISIFAAAVSKLLRRCSSRSRFLTLGIFLLLYCAVTGFAPSVVRASVMAMTAALAEVVDRRYDAPSALSLAFLILLIVQPYSIFQAGFQLSFSAVAGILLLQPLLADLLKRLFAPLRDSLSVSAAASIGILPATISTFHRLPLLGLFANLIAVSLAPLILLPALVSVCLNGFLPPIAKIIALPVKALLEILLAVIRFAASIPGGVLHMASPSALAWILFACACVLASSFFLRPLRNRLICLGIALFLCIACCVIPQWTAPETQIIALYQQYGGSLIIESDDAVILLHPGSGKYTPAADWLAYHGITEVDAVFVADAAQANAAAAIADETKIEHILFYGTDSSVKEILMENYLICESFHADEKMTLDNELSVTIKDSLWVDVEGITLCIGDSDHNAAVRFGTGDEGSFHADGLFICTGGIVREQFGRILHLQDTGQLTLVSEEGKIRVRTYQPK